MGGFFIFLGLFLFIFILFFPLYVETDFHYQLQDKKIAVAVYLCKHFKILGGYLTDCPGGFALHISREKARLLPIFDRKGGLQKANFLHRFQISNFAITTETGAEYIPLAICLHAVIKGYFLYQGGEKEGFQSHIWLKNGEDFLITIHSVARINLYMQICTGIRLLKEKWRNARRKQAN